MNRNKSDRKFTVYMKRGCVTCRRTIDYLEARKVNYQTVEFFKQPLSKDKIKSLLKMAGLSPQQALRKKDKMFRQLHLDKKNVTDEGLLSLMEKYPGLILRPIVVLGERAVIATKAEMIDQLLLDSSAPRAE